MPRRPRLAVPGIPWLIIQRGNNRDVTTKGKKGSVPFFPFSLSLVSSFGMGQVAGALTNTFMGSLGDALKNVINNSPLPNFLKSMGSDSIDCNSRAYYPAPRRWPGHR